MKYRLRIFIPILIGAIGLSVATNFSAAEEVASDNELYAGYCFGAFSESLNAMGDLVAEMQMDTDPLMAEGNAQALNEIKQRKQRMLRFKAYLESRGFLTGHRSDQAVAGVKLAIQRGQTDTTNCGKAFKACMSSCTQDGKIGYNHERFSKCLDQCIWPGRTEQRAKADKYHACASTMIERCDKADNLPF